MQFYNAFMSLPKYLTNQRYVKKIKQNIQNQYHGGLKNAL